MRKKLFRILAVALAVVVGVTTITPTSVYATQTSDIQIENEEETVSENSTVSNNDIELFGEEDKVNYLYLDNNYIEAPGNELVMVSFGDENTVISEATLVVENCETKEKSYFHSEDTMNNMVLFTMEYTTEDQGIYEVVAISVTTEEAKTKYVQFSNTGMDNVYFGVNEQLVLAEEEPLVLNETEEQVVETQIVTFDEGEVADTESEEIVEAVEEALDEAETNIKDETLDVEAPLSAVSIMNVGTVGAEGATTVSADDNLVVVLDPGHDDTHAGAQANGLGEEDITLKIAKYCEEELENYAGVTVYMTRTGGACPYPGTTSTVCNKNRVSYAQSVGADVYVSIHLNSASNTSANGAEVFYPNSNYNASIGTEGANLATKISRQLAALGLNNRGIAIRNSGDNTLYPDGSLADYYGVIKNSKLAGFPAIIVEHAFMTNASDAAFLSKEENLKKLGIADATGIAEYYGLSEAYDFTSGAIEFSNINHAAGTFRASIGGIAPAASVKEVRMAAWTQSDGSDMRWYIAKLVNGKYIVDFNVANHKYNSGTYYVHVYVKAPNGKSYYLQGSSVQITEPKMSLTDLKAVDNSDGTVTITSQGDGFSTLQYGVWSENGGQDDLKWYTAKKNASGQWQVSVPLKDHKTAGRYQVHAYGTNAYGTKFLKLTTFTYNAPKASSVLVSDINSGAGTFKITTSGFTGSSAVSKVEVAVWSKSDQSDIKWYTASADGKGAYVVNANLANHNYNYGNYIIHVYATDAIGVRACATTAKATISQPKAVITAVGNTLQTQYTLKASSVGMAGGVKKVEFAVWSESGGQDDLIWYTGKNAGSGVWTANAIISNHRTAGKYQVHVYATNTAGKKQMIGSITYNVEGPKADKVEIININDKEGSFTVNAVNVSSAAMIEKVEYAVWSKADQSDLRWYTDTVGENGTYTVNANIANHNYNYGTYNVHVYATDKAGIRGFIKGSTVKIAQPKAVITAVGNNQQTQYTLKADSVALAGGVKKVEFAVWSESGGQDDLIWYTGKNAGSSAWIANAIISNHRTAGKYQVHVYATNTAGKKQMIGSATFNVEGPKASRVETINVDAVAGTFTINAINVTSLADIEKVEYAVWSKADQSDLRWYTDTVGENGTYTVNANIANHNYNYGTYNVHVYATDKAGIRGFIKGTTVNIPQPKAVVTATGNSTQTQYALKATSVGMAGGVKKVEFAVWSTEGGQDDLKWYSGKNDGSGNWTTNALIANHKTAGQYNVHVYVTNNAGKKLFVGSAFFSVTRPTAKSVAVTNKQESDGLFSVKISGITSPSGVKQMRVGVWCATNQSDLVWYNATKQSDGSYMITVDVRNHKNNTGKYQAHAYITAGNGIYCYTGATNCSIINVTNILHPITGSSSVTVEQMMAYYNSVTTYPDYYKNSDAPTLRTFCQMYLDECNAEGIKAEVAFVQAMKETNFLRYGGDVDISQYNFAGLGATGGVPGNSFATVRIGIRAQVQHLKAYANSEPLNLECVDSRFKYVARGTAPYCEWLGINENPYGKGWATAVNYGYDIVTRMNKLKSY